MSSNHETKIKGCNAIVASIIFKGSFFSENTKECLESIMTILTNMGVKLNELTIPKIDGDFLRNSYTNKEISNLQTNLEELLENHGDNSIRELAQIILSSLIFQSSNHTTHVALASIAQA